jgi:hypothetical protein
MSNIPPTHKRCSETRAHYAHEWYNPLRIQCPGGPDETPEEPPTLGTVQQARWGEWEAVCTVARCGWRHSQGNRTQAAAEKHMRNHAALVHPPRIPVRAADAAPMRAQSNEPEGASHHG